MCQGNARMGPRVAWQGQADGHFSACHIGFALTDFTILAGDLSEESTEQIESRSVGGPATSRDTKSA